MSPADNDVSGPSAGTSMASAPAVVRQTSLEERARMLELLLDVADAANRAGSIEAALAQVLRLVSEFDGWAFGHAYLVGRNEPRRLLLARSHYASAPDRFQPFREATPRVVEPNEGLPGRVWASGEPEWVSDLTGELAGDRGGLARKLRIRRAAAFPILVRDRVVGVLELFSDERIQPGERTRSVMASVGIQLGRVVERVELQREMATLAVAEQRRIGQELHDDLGQIVTAVRMMAETVQRRLGTHEPQLTGRLVRAASDAEAHVRGLIRGLVPVQIQAQGLTAALRDLIARVSEESGREVALDRCEPAGVTDDLVATSLWCIAREAIHNAVIHAEPSRISVELLRDSARHGALLTVTDDGAGMSDDPGETGSGTRIMRHRVALIGGRLEHADAPGGGTVVRCWVPLEPNPDRDIQTESLP